MRIRVVFFLLGAVVIGCGFVPNWSLTPFSMALIPRTLAPAIPHQKSVLLLSVADESGGGTAGGAVTLSATAQDCEVTISPTAPTPGQVAEVNVTPNDSAVNKTITLTVRGERGAIERTTTASFEVWEGEDTAAAEAAAMRDKFIPWLTANLPELGIASDTQWTGIVVRPIWLVVTHYLFFSDEWEMGVAWHIMVPPYDWTRIYLRHRFDESRPSYAFEISSRSDITAEPHAIDPPEEVWR